MIEKIKKGRQIVTCHSCDVPTDDEPEGKAGKIWRPRLCISQIGMALAMIYIVVTQIMVM